MRRAIYVSILLLFTSLLQGQHLNVRLLENVKANNLDSVRWLFGQGADVNYRDSNLAPILMWAAYKADLEMCQFLVGHGANHQLKGVIFIDTIGSYYGNLLGILAGEGKVDLLEYFLDSMKIPVDDMEWNLETNEDDGWTALHWAASRGQTRVCNILLEYDANINQNEIKNQTSPLLCSMHNGYYQTSEFLLSQGADVTITNISGWKAMHYVARDGQIALLERILAVDSKIDAKTLQERFTPLILAAYNNSIEACSVLVENGANLRERDFYGLTALDRAKNENFGNVVKYLKNPSKHRDIYSLMGWEELHVMFKKEFHQKAYSKALTLGFYYLKSAKKEFGQSHVAYGITLNNLAMAHQFVGNYNHARILYQEAIKFHPSSQESMYHTYRYNLASLYGLIGEYENARIIFIDVLGFVEQKSGIEDPEYGKCLSNLAKVYLDLGLYQKGLLAYQQALKNCKDNYGETHESYVIRLKGMGDAFLQLGYYQKALSVYNEALKICEKNQGKDHLNYGAILNGLGHLHELMAKYIKAAELYSGALEIVKNSSGVDHPDYGACLSNLGGIYRIQGKYELALKTYQESLQNCEKNFGKVHPAYVVRLSNFANLLSSMGNFKKALFLYDVALENCSTLLEENHPTQGMLLNGKAKVLTDLGKYNQALQLNLKSLEIIEETLTEEHPKHMNIRNGIGISYSNLGRYEQSISIYQQLLIDCSNSLGKFHPDYGLYLSNAASAYLSAGKYEKSLDYYQDALRNCEENQGKLHPTYANRLNGLANLYESLGQYERALSLLEQAFEISKDALGSTHPEMATSLMSIGGCYHFLGSDSIAILYYDKALKNIEANLGQNHLKYGECMNSLAISYQGEGIYQRAAFLFKRVLENLENNVGIDHPKYASGLGNLAGLYQQQGLYQDAEVLYEKAFEILKSTVGDDHPAYLIFLRNYIVLLDKTDKKNKIFNVVTMVNQLQLKLIRRQFEFLVNAEHISYIQEMREGFNLIHSLSYASMSNIMMSSMNFNNELIIKGLILNNKRDMAKQIITRGSPEDSTLFLDWLALKLRISDQYILPEVTESNQLLKWESAADSMERVLVKRSSAFAMEQQKKDLSWQQVRDQLEQNELAIEFSHFDYYNNGWSDSTLYVAYLLLANSEHPEMVYLFEEDELDSLVQKSGFSSLYPSRGFSAVPDKKSGKGLYETVWSALEPYLEGVETIYYAPSGKLHQIAFAALVDSTGQLLSEKYQLVQLSSTGKLVVPEPEPEPSPAEFIGGIQYHFDTTQNNKGESFIQVYNPIRSAGNRKSLNYLSGTAAETNALFKLYQSNTLPASRISKSTATEGYVKSLSGNSPKVLHLATHGFFFTNPEDKHDDFLPLQGPKFFTLADDPLMRSGLLMAGASYAWEHGQNPYTKEDGILTAYEISHLDLSKTDLVVLSACETGLGDIEGSEGVYGLQRAFRMAGVEYMIMSLWAVPDKESSEFMQLFYKTWLGGKGIYEAFTETQRSMAANYRNDPQKWAGFVLVQ